MTPSRLMTDNVLSLRRGTERVAAVIRACDPDVVCVQEAPRFLFWRRHCRALAAQAGLTVVTGGRPAAANLLLARPGLAVTSRTSIKLPWHPPRHRRGLAIGVLDLEGTEVVVASTHLSLDDAERLDQVHRVIRHLENVARPAVLAGDVNETPDDPAWRVLASALADAYVAAPVGDGRTSTAEHPRRRLDAIFVDRRIAVVSCGVPDVPGLAEASDHRPLLAVVEIE